MADFKESHWVLLDLLIDELVDGYRLTATTDVPCHLYCRMTTTPPRKHSMPSPRRGTFLQGEVRFCFVVYEDNEQDEPGDTLVHTWVKSPWPPCETRWFYFIGTQGEAPSVSETCIFKLHFEGPPAPPPEPVTRQFTCFDDNRTIQSNWGTWPITRNGINLRVRPEYGAPRYHLTTGWSGTVSYFITRSFFRFDTSDIPDDAEILEANLKLYIITAGWDAGSKPNIYVEPGYQSTPVVTGDWYPQNPETLILATKDLWTVTFGVYNDWPFNSDGLAHINKAGITKLCTIGQNDFENVDPGLMARHSFNCHSYQKGLGFRPILEVKYQPA